MTKTILNIIQSNAKGGGMENVFLDYSKILQKNKKFKLICITSKKFAHIQQLKQENIKIHFLNISGHFDIFATIKLYFLIRKYSPNLIIAHNGRAFAAINLCKKIFGNLINFKAKLMAVSHGGSVKRILNFDYIVAVADHIRKKITSTNFKGEICTIYNGIKIIDFQRPKIANKNKEKNKQFTFGILSRLSKEKNIKSAIEAFAKFVKEINQNSFLTIAGQGNELENLKETTINLGIEDKVNFIGWADDKERFFSKIDVFLQPALSEPFGITILESFNYYKPVLAADSYGPKEIIKNNYNGFLFDIKDKNSLFKAMENIYNIYNSNQIDQITKNAFLELENNFSYQKMRGDLNKFVDKIL